MTLIDEDALTRAMAACRAENAGRANQIERSCMDANMQAQEVCLKVLCVFDPRPLIDAWGSSLL